MANLNNHYFFVRENATDEDYMDALYDDSVAFGVGCTVITLFQFITCLISVDLLNFSALRLVSNLAD